MSKDDFGINLKLSDEELELSKAMNVIGDAFGNFDETLYDGLPEDQGGNGNEDWGYDKQLVFDIAEAVRKWKERISNEKD